MSLKSFFSLAFLSALLIIGLEAQTPSDSCGKPDDDFCLPKGKVEPNTCDCGHFFICRDDGEYHDVDCPGDWEFDIILHACMQEGALTACNCEEFGLCP